MGNFEEVRNKIAIWQRNPDIYLGHGKGYRKMTIDDLALQICQLKDAEFAKVLGDSVKAWHERLKEKDAECRERVERIFEIVDGKTATRNEVDIKDKKVKLFRLTRISNEEWQALLGREGVK